MIDGETEREGQGGGEPLPEAPGADVSDTVDPAPQEVPPEEDEAAKLGDFA